MDQLGWVVKMTTLKVLYMYVHVLCHVQLFATPWSVAHQAFLSLGFPRQEYWSGLSFPPPGDLPNPGIEPESPLFLALQADALQLSHWKSSGDKECWGALRTQDACKSHVSQNLFLIPHL